jgi:hypothetical protein
MGEHIPRDALRTNQTREQRCALHLLDLCRAYPCDPARPQALALLEPYRAQGAEARKRAELARAAAARASSPWIRRGAGCLESFVGAPAWRRGRRRRRSRSRLLELADAPDSWGSDDNGSG